MTETLSANPSEIAGLGLLLTSIGADVQSASDFVAKEGKAADRLHGPIIDSLVQCLEPIPGNWSEIRRLGEVYKAAGNGIEACGKNLECAGEVSDMIKELADATRAVAVGQDIAQIADYGDTTNRPTQSYDVGSGTAPWENS